MFTADTPDQSCEVLSVVSGEVLSVVSGSPFGSNALVVSDRVLHVSAQSAFLSRGGRRSRAPRPYWTSVPRPYDAFVAGNDAPLIDERTATLGAAQRVATSAAV